MFVVGGRGVMFVSGDVASQADFDVSAIVKRIGRVPERDAFDLAFQVSGALEEAAGLGIIHRAFIRLDGERRTAKGTLGGKQVLFHGSLRAAGRAGDLGRPTSVGSVW